MIHAMSMNECTEAELIALSILFALGHFFSVKIVPFLQNFVLNSIKREQIYSKIIKRKFSPAILELR